jgi:hypothetical protein
MYEKALDEIVNKGGLKENTAELLLGKFDTFLRRFMTSEAQQVFDAWIVRTKAEMTGQLNSAM